MPLIPVFGVTYDECSGLRGGQIGVYAHAVPRRRRPEDRKLVGGQGPTAIANMRALAYARGIGTTLTALATFTGIDLGTLSYWHTDQRHPDANTLVQAAQAFGVTYQELTSIRPSKGADKQSIPSQSGEAPPTQGQTIMDGRRTRALAQLREFLADLDTAEELRAAVKGAMEGVEAYHRGRLHGPAPHEHDPPGHKTRR